MSMKNGETTGMRDDEFRKEDGETTATMQDEQVDERSSPTSLLKNYPVYPQVQV